MPIIIKPITATFSRQLTAWLIFTMISALYLGSLWALFDYRQGESLWTFAESLQIVQTSLYQAGLSALLSTLIGLLCAQAFFYLDFSGKKLLYKFCSFAWALPSLVVIFAVIGVWGNNGWLGTWLPSFYGLNGILIAHLFLNIPLATKYSLETLSRIPEAQHKLAAQLGFTPWQMWRLVELPALMQTLPHSFGTIFLLCFTSFPIVLMLGGGPKYSTLEVAIYQAVTFEFDFNKAIGLILLQALLGISLHTVLERLPKPQNVIDDNRGYRLPYSRSARLFLAIALCLIAVFMLLPQINILWQAASVDHFFTRLTNPALWRALRYSTLLSLISAFTVVLLAYLLALETRRLRYAQKKARHTLLSAVVMLPLLLPVFLPAVGLFVWLIEVELSDFALLWLVGACNGLMLLPYVYRLIFYPLYASLQRYAKLAHHLGLSGINGWWIVEKNALIRPLANAFALSMSASLGSFAVIAFFGNHHFSSLPYLLYQQIGSYRYNDAAITALVLMLAALLPFLFIDQQEGKND